MKKSKTKKKSSTRTNRPAAAPRPALVERESLPASPRQPQKPPKKDGEPRLDVNGIKTNGRMELEPHLLSMRTSGAIARSLKRSADRSIGLETSPFHSAMSVLNGLVSHVEMLRARLEAAKKDLRKLYGESDEDKPMIPHESTPPQEFAKKRNGDKTTPAAPKNNKPADNRPRSRPNKLV
ncbi:MAG TPA: DUF3175 domain-containing protein [Candidatus Krumholzibacteria bacterium]